LHRVTADRRNERALDGPVNAAGIVAIGTVEDTDFATRRRVLAINLDGTFLGCKYALPLPAPAARSSTFRPSPVWSAATISRPTTRRRAACGF
jgi:NAD(P)-dependent dehydrogenase (short-subunit alcohol dehydrogenase family)